jgi:hypothetical protein
MSAARAAAAEFSRLLTVAAIRPGGESLSLEATEGERAALARRLGVEGVRSLTARLAVAPKAKGAVEVRGRVRASLDRTCVVSLEPLVEEIDAPFAILFRPEGSEEPELAIDADAEDEEPYRGGVIDLGEAVSQTLALALDPWPRAEGAALPEKPTG